MGTQKLSKSDLLPVGTRVRLLHGKWEGTETEIRGYINAGFRGWEYCLEGVPGTWNQVEVI